jgi:hypothetical protein
MDAKLEQRINKFTDGENRTWTVRVTVGVIKEVRNLFQLDINEALNPQSGVIDKLADDPVMMMDVIYVCCRPQMDAKGVSVEDFSDSITGDTIEQASKALVDAVVDFFPRSKTEVIRESLALRDKMMMRIKNKAMKELTSMSDKDMDRAVEKLLEKLGDVSMPVQEFSA